MRRAIALLFLLTACSGRTTAPPDKGRATPSPTVATSGANVHADGGARARAERDGYAGAAACTDCHVKKHAAWSKTWHARALAKASERGAVVGNFHGAHFAGTSSEAWM